MKLIGVKTNDGYYVTDDLANKNNYYNSSTALNTMLINGEKPQQTFHKNWVKVKSEPILIQRYVVQPPINKRFELIDKSLSDKFKDVWIESDARFYGEDGYIYSEGFYVALYEYKQDEQPDILEDVEFEYQTVSEIEEIKAPKSFSYKRSGEWDNTKNYGFVTEKDVKYDMIAQVITPPILLHTQPCKLTAKESYDIIRKYIKENINPKVAEVSSDYDFCLTVKKKIELAKPHQYQVDVNNSFFSSKKRKPKYENRLQVDSKITIFECAPKPYQSYTVVTPFSADNSDDLKELIDNYLSHIISVINEPLKYCSCCEGTGVELNTLTKQVK